MVMVHIPMVSFPYHPVKWGDGGKDNTNSFLKTKWQMPVEVEGGEGLGLASTTISLVRDLLSGKGMKDE